MRWLKIKDNVTKNKKDDNIMDKNILTMTRPKISSSHFDKCKSAIEIKRVGRKIVIATRDGAIPISRDSVTQLTKQIEQGNKSVKIRANGLSRAQVGRIAGDLKNSSGMGVYIRRAPVKQTPIGRSSVGRYGQAQLMNYEILVTDGNYDEE